MRKTESKQIWGLFRIEGQTRLAAVNGDEAVRGERMTRMNRFTCLGGRVSMPALRTGNTGLEMRRGTQAGLGVLLLI